MEKFFKNGSEYFGWIKNNNGIKMQIKPWSEIDHTL